MSGNLTTSLVRTLIPIAVGALSSLGLGAEDENVSVILAAVIAFGFYAVVRFLEVYAGPKWGYILGVAKSPGYSPADPPAPAPLLTDNDHGSVVLWLLAGIGLLFLLLIFVPGVFA